MAAQVDFAHLNSAPEKVLEAKRNSNGGVYVITGDYGLKDSVPPDAIAGRKVGSSGNIVMGSFQANQKYKPTQGG